MLPSRDILSIITVFLIAALIGLTVVKVVETRMTDISINMPTIKFPQQKIIVQLQDEDPGTGLSANIHKKEGTIVYNSLESLRDIITETKAGVQAGGSPSSDMICKKTLPSARSDYDAGLYKSRTEAIQKPTIVVPEASTLQGQTSYPAKYPRASPLLTEPTYYMDPSRMTADQLAKFQQRAKFENMTVIDYQNWLLTFRNDPGRLTGFHRGNLKVLLRGGQLDPTDMPQRTRIPDNSRDQYSRIMHDQVNDNIPQPEFLGYQPHNYEQDMGYPADTNRNLRHLDYVNPDEPLKTWILTREGSR